jgi:glycosyltransferase involved in cell wall biosynthesis
MERFMKIAVIHDLPVGGALRVVGEQVKWFKKNGYEVEVVDSKTDDNIKHKGLMRVLREWYLLTGYQQKMKQLAETINREYTVAVVHPSQTIQAHQILRYLTIPSIYVCQEWYREWYEPDLHHLPHQMPNKLYEWFVRWLKSRLDKLAAAKATRIMVGSKYVANQVQKAYQRQATINPYGVDTDIFKPVANPSRDYQLYIGSKCEIDGYNEWLKLKQVGDREIIFGESQRISDAELAKLYANAKYVVSLGKNEPFGLVPLEAMACGTKPIVREEGGYLETKIQTNDSQQLRNHVKQNYNWQQHGEKLLGLIGQII